MHPNLAALPPGPKASAAWQLLRYNFSPLSFLEECARRHGDPFTMRLAGYGTFVVLSDPKAIQDVFHGDGHALHSGEGNEFLSVTLGNSSVLVLDEEPHARQRRLLMPPLKGERMRSFFDAMRAETEAAVREWPLGRPIPVLEPMRRITLRVILRAVLGLTPGPELDGIEAKVHKLLAQGRSRFSLILLKVLPVRLLQKSRWGPYFRQLRDLDESLYSLIASRRGQPEEARGDSVLADLLRARHEDGRPLSDQEVRDAVVTLLVAGHETTALTLAWAVEQIVPRPDVVGRITAELEQTTGGGPPRADQLPRLEYLDAAVRESLRLRTVLPLVVRLTTRPFVAGGREYPAGVMLTPCNHLVHRRPDLYPEPEQFRPERFLERKYAAHEWFPFGGGNRMCLGMAFALYEMKVVLSTLLARACLARPAGSRSDPVRCGLSVAPNDGVRVVLGRPKF